MHNKNEPVFVLLAAGKSRRFGRNKLLALLPNGKTVLQQSYDNLRSITSNILVVLNSEMPLPHSLREYFGSNTLEFSSEGMGESIAEAIKHSAEHNAWVLCLADMPYIQTQSLQLFGTAIARHPDSIVRVRCGKIAGHPVYFPRDCFEDLSVLRGDQGAKTVLAKHKQRLHWCDVNDEGVLRDIDEPADLAG